jgi:hypothetical protein
MSRNGRFVLSAFACLLLAPTVAQAAPKPTFSTLDGVTAGKFQSSTTYDTVTGTSTAGDGDFRLPPSLPVRPGEDVTITLDTPADALDAQMMTVGDLPATQIGGRTYRVHVPESVTLPVLLIAAIHSTDPGFQRRQDWTIDLRLPAGYAAPQVSTAWTAPLTPKLTFADHRDTSGETPMPPVAPTPDDALPRMIGAAGAPVKIQLDGRVGSLSATFGSMPLAVTKLDDLTFTTVLPAGATFPGRLSVDTDSSSMFIIDSAHSAVMVDSVPAVRGTETATVKPVSPATVSRLRVSGRRLQATITCSMTCPGVLTLRSGGFRVARVTVAGPGIVKTRLRAKAQRFLKRHHPKTLRAVLTTRGHAPKAATLKVQR